MDSSSGPIVLSTSSSDSSSSSDRSASASSSDSESSAVEIVSGPAKSALPFSFASCRKRGTRAQCKTCCHFKFNKASTELTPQPSLEVFFRDRWWTVDSIREEEASSGAYIVRCVEFEKKDVRIDLQCIRLSSRRASDEDCILLKEGVDVCVFARHPQTNVKAWHDANIDKVHKRPHDTKCDCRIIVKLYSIGDKVTDLTTLKHKPETVGIARIKILQAPNHIDFEEVVQAAIQPGLAKRVWSRDVGSIKSKHDGSRYGLGIQRHRHHHHDHHHRHGCYELEVIDDDSSSDDFEALLDAELRPTEVVDSDEEDYVDRLNERTYVSPRKPVQGVRRSKEKAKKTKRPGNEQTLRHREKSSSRRDALKDKTPKVKKKSKSLKRKREDDRATRGDRASAHRKKSRKRTETDIYTHLAEEDLEKEQGYLVSLEDYWNRKHVSFEPEPTMEEKILREMEMVFPRKTEEDEAPRMSSFDDICEVHDYVLNELVGLICSVCGYVGIPIEEMAPHPDWSFRLPQNVLENPDPFIRRPELNDLNDDLADDPYFPSTDTRRSLHAHQRRAVRFMKRNIVDEEGGCILAHAPGTGKTFATVYFYLKYKEIMAGCRLLVLCPKMVQNVWREEFRKSQMETPFFLSSRKSRRLEVLSRWHRQRGVLVMGFTLFMKMSLKKEYRSYMLESPELVILDEGHTLRSNGTLLRNAVMNMKTKLRILLSGTLFQNTFEELFNLIFLARPNFIQQLQMEDRARRWFIKEIGRKFDDGHGHREMQAAQMKLVKMTQGFTDHYTGAILTEVLPGLRDYEITTAMTELQHKLVAAVAGTLEMDITRTRISIHPLLRSAEAAGGDFSAVAAEVVDVRASMKTAFVMKLIELCQCANEKVLVFGEFLAPFHLLLRMLELERGWSRDKEVVFLHGALVTEERHELMDRFNAEGSEARVCLASIRACAEGITLVGASRVVLLHPVWNPAQTNQAISRAFRLGQKRKVFVYRLVTEVETVKNSRTKWKDFCSEAIFETAGSAAPRPQEPASLSAEEIFSEDKLLAQIHAEGMVLRVCYRDHFFEQGENQTPGSQ
ncbi:SNF2 domain-containing protein CLASSY 1 [Selaginella moellendorffii]|uniref:SNF2 domain-containing protein CLASSY 1 n=1 Tax=Selaginella moellendorffii TaxID=88036 RepID=UPI000D1C6CD5|nr:SNF2 domain-containing protein CLASSY 1 [Selaginella moellendorffii]|eukprot:XP_024531210.1 SNF2 domain-containing protein CLASSY 1 [Selaginella moellendorffii]